MPAEHNLSAHFFSSMEHVDTYHWRTFKFLSILVCNTLIFDSTYQQHVVCVRERRALLYHSLFHTFKDNFTIYVPANRKFCSCAFSVPRVASALRRPKSPTTTLCPIVTSTLYQTGNHQQFRDWHSTSTVHLVQVDSSLSHT